MAIINRRKLLEGAAAIGTFATLPLLREAAAQATPRRGGILRVSVNARVDNLNPMKPKSSAGHMVSEMLYGSLTRIGLDLQPQPDIAESWQANADATAFTFKIRPGIKFHDGTPLTSADAVATIKAILDPATASAGRTQLGPIKDVTAPDPMTVVFTLTGPFADLPVLLGTVYAKIISAAALAGDRALLDTKPFGSGPFVLTEYDPGRVVRVRRNAAYYDQTRPYLDGVDQFLYPDATAEVAALINRDTDLLLEASPVTFGRLKSTPGIAAERAATGNFLNLVLRCDAPPFNNPKVRKALALALDRQALVDLVLEGYGRPAYDTFISPEYPFTTPLAPAEYSVTRAKQMLTEAGFPQGVKVTLYAAAIPPLRTALGVAVRELARPAGFDIEVKTVGMDEYIASVWRKQNFYVGSWNMGPTQDYWFSTLLTSTAAFGDAAWNNARFDEIVAAARRTVNADERKKLYAEAQTLVTTELPYIVPFYLDRLVALRDTVKGFALHPLNQPYSLDRVWLAA